MLKVGDAAPDFVLKDADTSDVRLSSYLGKPVVVYFYPKDHTPGCIAEAKAFQALHGDFEAAGAIVLGVSLDDTDSHCSFRDRYGLGYLLLSDVEGRVHDLYGAWRTTLLGRNLMGVRRCTYLIDARGVIANVYKRIHPVRHPKEVLDDIRALEAPKSAEPVAAG